jgi:hypothetical protein
MSNIKISYTPAHINRVNVDDKPSVSSKSITESIALAQKFVRHIGAIKEWQERIASIEHLAENAKKLSGSISYKSVDQDVISAIKYFGDNDDEVDLDLFIRCVDIVIDGYKQQALVGLAGDND